MKLEDFGAPLPSESPERRYASLHRTIEAGTANDKTWADLVHTCLQLNKPDEALTAVGCIHDGALRERTERLLLAEGTHAQRRVVPTTDPRLPSRSQIVEQDDESITENIVDAFRFLFLDQMPLTVIFVTLTFPLVVGLGGFLTRDSHAMLFPLIAMIPALSVVGLVGALGRRITLEAAKGLDDPPVIPPIRELSRDALRFLVDVGVLGAIFLAPGLTCLAIDTVGTPAALVMLGLGVFLMPMAMGIRQMTHDWRALSPNVLFPAIVRCGQRYLALAACTGVLFLPAGLSAWFSAGSQLYLQISVVGPLMVAPLFVIARLLGQTMHLHRGQLAEFFGVPERQKERIVDAREIASGKRARPSAPPARSPLHQGTRHPEAARKTRTAAATQAPPQQPQKSRPAPLAKARPLGAAPKPTKQSAPPPPALATAGAAPTRTGGVHRAVPPTASAPTPRPVRRQPTPPTPSGNPASGSNTRVHIEEVRGNTTSSSMPDLSNIPGAHVVSGAARVRAGASANQPSGDSRRPF